MRRSVVILSTLLMAMITFVLPVAWAEDSVTQVDVSDQKVELTATAGFDKVRYFTLDSPKRLVVDLYGVQPGPHEKNIVLNDGFKELRLGPYADKTRFVFDVADDVFPIFQVAPEEDRVTVTWSPAQNVQQQVKAEPAMVGSSQVTAIDFTSSTGISNLLVTLDGAAVATEPQMSGNKVQFTLQNATLPRALRRIFDTLSFPSAIYSVSPYQVNNAGRPDVNFVVTLKGDVPYQLNKTTDGFVFAVTDGQYAEATPAMTGVLPVAVDEEMTAATMAAASNRQVQAAAQEGTFVAGNAVPVVEQIDADTTRYTGAKTSLVFDNAEVRDVLRLIAEISDLNIITSDEVAGNITLRLIDVPWDQALDLVLEITNLKMVQKGNVVRILPKDVYNKMVAEELTAQQSQEQLEPLETEIVPVSYADLGSVAGPAKELLSDRGTITEDNRNKLLIITDVSERIRKARQLIEILDTPERQVMIEARIVEVSTEYSRDLGVNWAVQNADGSHDPSSIGIAGGGEFIVGDALAPIGGLGSSFTFGDVLVDSTILDLRISALQSSSKLKVVSTPKVTTLNGEEALIKTGTEQPYQTVEDGEVKIEFKEAVLELKVKPVINPDGSIILEIDAKNDSLIPEAAGALTKKQAKTKVLVMDGETTVLGGVFIDRDGEGEGGVPFLSSVPLLGHLFKSTSVEDSKDELLIFITPRIVKN